MKINSQQIVFKVDFHELVGELHLPGTKRPPLVVGSHGLEGSRASAKQLVLSRLLPENNIAFFRFDHRGCGQSQGDFTQDTSLEKRTKDYTGAVQHILSLGLTSDRVGLFGSSMGGATCINAWSKLKSLGISPAGGVLCASPMKSLTIKNIPLDATDKRPALDLDFFKKNLLFDLRDRVKKLHNVLIFHGDADEVVPVSNAHDIYRGMLPPKKKIIQANGKHQMNIKEHQAEFEKEALAWFRKIFTPAVN